MIRSDALPVQIVGAGLAGTLLAILLAQRGFPVRVFEKRADPRSAAPGGGRSINLALAARGLRALEAAGLAERLQPALLPLRGRIVHEPGTPETLQPYGQAPHEVIYSVSRAQLNLELVRAAAELPNVELRFEQTLLGVAPASNTLQLRDNRGGWPYECALAPTICVDGAASAARQSLAAGGWLQASEELLDHGYKELTIPSRGGEFALDPQGLHIWPRGGYMLIALPNPDRSFTATLFLPHQGAAASFAALRDDAAVQAFFATQFPDAVALMPELLGEFAAHPVGLLGTVRADRWQIDGRCLLLGDAAHAIVPFHGQGVNCAFEDCLALCVLLDDGADWPEAFATLERTRRADVEAIAQMALENYYEMRDGVRDPQYLAERELALLLERWYPQQLIPRYSMVMFHPEIPYSVAQRRGAEQQ
ncbi:MAG: FAD-dependent monooxygenase, partial [Steroidobacteraceae bacterium]|nr:FAD-dependent monooxygenase [Steroidobacteraceae bacterium]